MTHKEARIAFTHHLAHLLALIFETPGYEAALDEVTERITTKDPTSDHMRNSLHHIGLAADVLLYRYGSYLTRTEDYTRFGEWWEKQDPHCKWGGRFGDGNHFSYAPPEIAGRRR